MCLVARAGPCDAASASTQEDDYAALCWQALIQLMRERATSLDAILPVLREKRVERAIARGLAALWRRTQPPVQAPARPLRVHYGRGDASHRAARHLRGRGGRYQGRASA